MVPVEISVKATVNGKVPEVGLAVKAAVGGTAPVPTTGFVKLPEALVTTTRLLKLPAVGGLKAIRRLVELEPGRSNGVPETILKGPGSTEAVPLERVVLPE